MKGKRYLTIPIVFFSFARALAQPLSTADLVDSSETEAHYILTHIDQFASREYFLRQGQLRMVQGQAYSEILYQLCVRDALSAIIDRLKMSLHIDFSLNHAPIYCRQTSGDVIVLMLDWTSPEDPWRRK